MEDGRPAAGHGAAAELASGDSSALARVAEIVDRELRRLASSYLRRERPGHTLQPTALVNEALLAADGPGRADRLGKPLAIHRHRRPPHAPDPGGPRAPEHRAAKRGAGATMISLDDAPAGTPPAFGRPDGLDEALNKLAEVDPRKARAMELKYFGGLEMAEIAAVLEHQREDGGEGCADGGRMAARRA